MTELLIDTSTERGVVGLASEGKILWGKELPIGFQTAQHLLPAIQEGLKEIGSAISLVKRIGIGCGPGSYTGIRVGVMIAQGLSYALQIPLVGLSSLELFLPQDPSQPHAAVIDAKIGGFYLSKAGFPPFLCPLEEALFHLADGQILVSPQVEPLRSRLLNLYPEHHWKWVESAPSLMRFGQLVEERKHAESAEVKILYLRKTQAELEKEGFAC